MDWKQISKTWGGFNPAIAAGPSGPVFRPVRWVLIPLLGLAFFTVLSRLGNFDYAAQKAIYVAGGDSWDFGNRSLWWFLYKFGTLPAGIACSFALVGFVLGLFREKWKRWRQCFLFIVLLGVIGPGVVSNMILKEYWGRPRPREVEGLGGQKVFEPVLTIDRSSGGKSFPCGHATMGYFFMGGYFLLRRYRRGWAWFFLAFGGCLGFFMGIARMCQGGHFFSDVIWSGFIMYFVAALLFYDLKLHRGILADPGTTRETPRWLKIAVPVIGVGLLAGLLLATPYRAVRDYHVKAEEISGPVDVNLVLKAGNVTIVPGDRFEAKGEAWGHGVPTSKVAVHFAVGNREKKTVLHYKERISGRFTEVDQDLHITLPWDRIQLLQIDAEECQVDIALPESLEKQTRIVIARGNGSIRFSSVPITLGWNDEEDRNGFGRTADPVSGGNPILDVQDEFDGNLSIIR